MNMKLTTLLNQNGKLVNNDRLKRLTKKVKQDKKKIMGLAETYNSKYKTEIIEGTKKRQLLIAAGEKEGLTEAQVIGSSGFLPTLSTPILN